MDMDLEYKLVYYKYFPMHPEMILHLDMVIVHPLQEMLHLKEQVT